MPRLLLFTLIVTIFGTTLAAASPAVASNPAATIQQAEQVLTELVAIPAQRIPQRLLAEAQGIAIIPRVIKVGFIAGVRRGQGVVMIRDAEGEWSLPQFITLTGGSIGWQAGIQGTDVVLVFKTRTSIERFMRGKFTIGADAAAAAGPVGRNAAAATDAQLQAEILSYSRSRGLFAGVSIDGSVLEMNEAANTLFYGAPSSQPPLHIPDAANALRLYLTELANAATPAPATPAAVAAANAEQAAAIAVAPPATPAPVPVSATRFDAIQNSLHANAAALHGLLAPEWQKFLAVPAMATPASAADSVALAAAYERYSRVSTMPEFKQLAERPEFQTTMELLREYLEALAASGPILRLPAPPTN